MEATVSVPGCVTLGGSHALVTDGPVVSSAIDARLRIRVERTDGDGVGIDSPFGSQQFRSDDLLDGDPKSAAAGAELTVEKGGRTVSGRAVLSAILDALGCTADEVTGLRFHIDRADAFPLGVGLSSSPALVVGCLAATAALGDRDLSRFEIAELAAKIEGSLWEHPHPVHPYAIAQGGTVHSEEPGDPIPFTAPLLIGLPKTSRSRAAVEERCRTIGSRFGARYDRLVDIGNGCTDAIAAAARAGDRSRVREELAFAGGLDEALGILSPQSRTVRARMLSHDDAVGVKQSDVGPRAVVLALLSTAGDAADVKRPLSQIGTETIETELSAEGLRYVDTPG